MGITQKVLDSECPLRIVFDCRGGARGVLQWCCPSRNPAWMAPTKQCALASHAPGPHGGNLPQHAPFLWNPSAQGWVRHLNHPRTARPQRRQDDHDLYTHSQPGRCRREESKRRIGRAEGRESYLKTPKTPIRLRCQAESLLISAVTSERKLSSYADKRPPTGSHAETR